MKYGLFTIILITLVGCGPESQPAPEAVAVSETAPKSGIWRVVMASPGGDLAFTLDLERLDSGWKASGHNGEEVVRFDKFVLNGDQFTFGIDHYESIFEGRVSNGGSRMDGVWTKVVGPGEISKLNFYADHGVAKRYPEGSAQDPATFEGRWSVMFTHEEDGDTPAVGVFRQQGSVLLGTFMTETGDYRFLEGVVNGREMTLSCFDGGHAFLFKAHLDETGALSGDFWSRDTWHEVWTAKRDETVAMNDAYSLTAIQSEDKQLRFHFPDLDGKMVGHDDPMLAGKPRLVVIFGSWCPNCNDEAPFLQELYQTYQDRGLMVLGLAFEMTGDATRDTRVLKRFVKRHQISYPILLAGVKDKEKAALKLPDLNHVRSYPTTLFIDRNNQVTSIHTGFTGPGTGQPYERLKQEFHEKIQGLLAE